ARALVHLHRLGLVLGDLAAHSGLQRALAGETKRNLVHSRLHSIKAEPHVRPAPIPVMSRRSPSCSIPAALASASASGIEPEEVLPYRSTSITVRSSGISSFFLACSMMRVFAWCGMYTSTSSTLRPAASRTSRAELIRTRV